MKLFRFDSKDLRFKQIPYSSVIVIILILSVAVLSLSVKMSKTIHEVIVIPEEAKTIVLQEQNKFSEELFDEYINSLNIKFPHIVKAQAVIESANFSSELFKANNNMFGMRVAKLRPTTNVGENLGHAVYNTWRDCVIDYAFYQAAYLKDIKSEEHYYQYLQKNYAEDSTYASVVKQLAKKFK